MTTNLTHKQRTVVAIPIAIAQPDPETGTFVSQLHSLVGHLKPQIDVGVTGVKVR